MEGSLLVTPEKLIETSSEFSTCMGQVQTLTSSMMEQVRGMSSFWEGEAATAYLNKLNEMASIYQKAESKSQEISGALSGNVL